LGSAQLITLTRRGKGRVGEEVAQQKREMGTSRGGGAFHSKPDNRSDERGKEKKGPVQPPPPRK